MKIGDRIKARREELGISQEDLAIKLGYKTRSSIAKIESDASGLPQSKIAKIAAALLTTPEYIMGWTEVNEENEKIRKITKLLPDASEDQLSQIEQYIRFVLHDK